MGSADRRGGSEANGARRAARREVQDHGMAKRTRETGLQDAGGESLKDRDAVDSEGGDARCKTGSTTRGTRRGEQDATSAASAGSPSRLRCRPPSARSSISKQRKSPAIPS